jgi:hypothetical protein
MNRAVWRRYKRRCADIVEDRVGLRDASVSASASASTAPDAAPVFPFASATSASTAPTAPFFPFANATSAAGAVAASVDGDVDARAINEAWLLHGTRGNEPVAVATSHVGIDMRYSKDGMYGRAAYFSEDTEYTSRDYAHRLHAPSALDATLSGAAGRAYTGQRRAVIIAAVARGAVQAVPRSHDARALRHPARGFHSVRGALTDSVHENGVMVYEPFQSYPAYVVCYEMDSPEVVAAAAAAAAVAAAAAAAAAVLARPPVAGQLSVRQGAATGAGRVAARRPRWWRRLAACVLRPFAPAH